jgi:carbamoyl-phosphate synthase large subunit
VKILLCSVGRRPYLVRWFREALIENGVDGEVIAADLDPLSPARSFADSFVHAPSVADPSYREWLSATLGDYKVDLAVSINDFELSEWAQISNDANWNPLVRLKADCQYLVEDKLAMAERLREKGILAPQTWRGTAATDLASTDKKYVTKGRFGSASRGLNFTHSTNLTAAIAAAITEVTTRQGQSAESQTTCAPEDLVVIQEQVVGTEYGLDVISDLHGNYAGVLARKKISMRAGETDRAVSVDPETFEEVARRISDAVPHPGTMDVDVIVDNEGNIFVIDINPRFGGGYPFSHLAGAKIPNAYIAWAAGLKVDPAWLRSESGVTGSKCVEVIAV